MLDSENFFGNYLQQRFGVAVRPAENVCQTETTKIILTAMPLLDDEDSKTAPFLESSQGLEILKYGGKND
jgi:hypothetical protein